MTKLKHARSRLAARWLLGKRLTSYGERINYRPMKFSTWVDKFTEDRSKYSPEAAPKMSGYAYARVDNKVSKLQLTHLNGKLEIKILEEQNGKNAGESGWGKSGDPILFKVPEGNNKRTLGWAWEKSSRVADMVFVQQGPTQTTPVAGKRLSP